MVSKRLDGWLRDRRAGSANLRGEPSGTGVAAVSPGEGHGSLSESGRKVAGFSKGGTPPRREIGEREQPAATIRTEMTIRLDRISGIVRIEA